MKIIRFPCIFNGLSLSGTTLASAAVYFHWIQGVLAWVTLIFSSGTAVFTCLVAIRRWYRGFKLEKHLDERK